MLALLWSSHWRSPIKRLFWKCSQYSQESTCAWVSFEQSCSLKRDSKRGVSLWAMRNFRNTYFQGHLLMAAKSSVYDFRQRLIRLDRWFTKCKLFLELHLKQFFMLPWNYGHECALVMRNFLKRYLLQKWVWDFVTFCSYKEKKKTWFLKAVGIRSFYIFLSIYQFRENKLLLAKMF